MMDNPANDSAEVTLIGTGGGYGESIVIHLGNQEWAVVDSCINPATKKSLPLEYLKQLGVDVAKQVKLIICTHWHNDHILGISELLEASVNAKFVMARPSDKSKFLLLVGIDSGKAKFGESASSTTEFKSCIEILSNRDSINMQAQANRLLYKNDYSEIYSLSPSDFTLSEYDKEISELITKFGASRFKLLVKDPNSKSVVLFIKLGNHRILLGADLMVSADDREGWLCILKDALVVDKPASLYKIPHHGSLNGFHILIWEKLLEKNPVAKLSPWNRKLKLPELEALEKFCDLSEKVFMTSKHVNLKPRKRSKRIEKLVTRFRKSLYETKFDAGYIICRVNMKCETPDWDVKLLDSAFHVNSEFEAVYS